MLPTSSEWEYFQPDGSSSIHGMERMLDDGTAINVLAYGTKEDPSEFSWLIRLWDDIAGRYEVVASYDWDIYYDDMESAYDGLVETLKHDYPDLIENDELTYAPEKAKHRFFEKAAMFKIAAAFALAIIGGVSLTGCDVQAAEYDDVALGSYTGSVCYSQLITDGSFAAGYDAMVDIMASGENPDTQEGTGWYDGDFEYEDLDMDMLNYACYDNPLYSMYRTGADNGVGMSVNTETGDVRIFSNATEQGDDFNAMYNEVDAIATNIVNQALAEADGSTAVYIQSLLQQLADSIEYSNDPSSAHTNDIYGALVNRSSRCYGYASAMKYMLDMQEIPNFIATGEMGGDRHAWNMVDMGGTWVVVDATASVGMMTAEGVSSLEDCQSPYYYCLRTLDTINKNTDNPYYLEDETIELLKM